METKRLYSAEEAKNLIFDDSSNSEEDSDIEPGSESSNGENMPDSDDGSDNSSNQ